VRWVQSDKTHVTIKFLGDVEETEIYQVCRATAEAVESAAPFQVQCRGLGAFPSSDRPRTVWLGVEDPDGLLERLQKSVQRALYQLRFPKEQRRFHPHITLGRARYGRRDAEGLVDYLHQHADVDGGPIPVEELVIFGSELTSDGPVYTVLGRAPLAAGS
jgi:2'-5' RNA ligase